MSQPEDYVITIESDIQETLKENLPPHNGKQITKMAISPQLKYVLTYSREDESFVGWLVKDDLGPLIIDEDIEQLPFSEYDFKVSDKKIILYDYNNLGKDKIISFK